MNNNYYPRINNINSPSLNTNNISSFSSHLVPVLKYSDFFIVTSDSTSMISECAFTGKPIYVFNLPFKRKSMRLERFHREFNNLNITKSINSKFHLKKWNYKTLDESKRIASILKERIIKA